MFSVINYSQEIDGKKAIVISYPSLKIRKGGAIKIGLYDDDNIVKWKYRKNVTDSLLPFSFVYSCITEDSKGNILDLYESDKAEISLQGYGVEELKVHDKAHLSLIEKIKSKHLNITKK